MARQTLLVVSSSGFEERKIESRANLKITIPILYTNFTHFNLEIHSN